MTNDALVEARRQLYNLCDEYGIVTRPLVEAVEAAVRADERARYQAQCSRCQKEPCTCPEGRLTWQDHALALEAAEADYQALVEAAREMEAARAKLLALHEDEIAKDHTLSDAAWADDVADAWAEYERTEERMYRAVAALEQPESAPTGGRDA